jgi:hypothetical protein
MRSPVPKALGPSSNVQALSARAALSPSALPAALPEEVLAFLVELLADCNRRIAFQLSVFPNAHEEALDLLLISHFASMQGVVKFGEHWTLRIDAHYIGGGRHYRTWEVADIGLLAIFRTNGRIVRSKIAFLQSKKLYASPIKFREQDPLYRTGMGRLLVTDEEHQELVEPKLLTYSTKSKYKALKAKDEQQDAMKHFSDLHGVKLQYLLYNPSVIPWSIKTPVEQLPTISENEVGCRVVPSAVVNSTLQNKAAAYSPSYLEITNAFEREVPGNTSGGGGWRLEHFVTSLFLNGDEATVDDSPNFGLVTRLLSQKTSPIASSLSITFDYKA